MNTSIEFQQVSIRRGARKVLQNVNCILAPGPIHLCRGRNGAGKSTFLRSLVGLERTSEGKIKSPFKPTEISYFPQASAIETQFPISVRELFDLTAKNQGTAIETLEAYDISYLKDRPLSELSGGELQLVLFARMDLVDSKMLVLDEPFNFMDSVFYSRCVQKLEKWRSQNKIVVLAAHQELASELSQVQTLDFADQTLIQNKIYSFMTASKVSNAVLHSAIH